MNPYNSGPGEGIMVREHTPHSTSMLSSLMRLGGEISSLVREDFKDLKIRVELFGLDMVIIKDRIDHLAQTKQLPKTAPMMPLFAVVPVAVQVDQPVVAPIDCEIGADLDVFMPHPDGGLRNGGFYCTDDEGDIHPGFLKCDVVQASGHTVGEGTEYCWDGSQPHGSEKTSFTRIGNLENPAPIVPTASPEPTASPSPQPTEVHEKASKLFFTPENIDEHTQNTLKGMGAALVAALGLFIAGIAWNLRDGGTGSRKVSVTSEEPPLPDKQLTPKPERPVHSADHTAPQPDFYEDYADSVARVLILWGKLLKKY